MALMRGSPGAILMGGVGDVNGDGFDGIFNWGFFAAPMVNIKLAKVMCVFKAQPDASSSWI